MTIPSTSKKAQLNWIVPDHFLVFFGTNKSGYDLLRAKSETQGTEKISINCSKS